MLGGVGGAYIGLLLAFYSPVPTRQCPPTDDEVSEHAASHTMACQTHRVRLTSLTRLFGAWQPVAVCLGTEQGAGVLNWTICMCGWGVARGGGHAGWLLAPLRPLFGFQKGNLIERNGFHAGGSQRLVVSECSHRG